MSDALATASKYPFASHTFHDNAPIFFYHTANIKEGTLTIQVLGPNLTFTFRHDKSLPKSRLSSSALLKKTVGFVAIAGFDPREGHRIIAWAQSGHGMGEGGDTLIAGDGALFNRVWARRTRKMARLLGLRSSHPFDKTSTRGEDARGSFLSAHVEAKLATHAVFTLLRTFKIQHDRANITKMDLRKLATQKFPSGEKPVIEVYFSRKNCNHCEQYLSRLQTITGVTIKPIWRHRLMRMAFSNEAIPDNPSARGALAMQQAEGDEDDDIMVIDHVEVNAPIEIPDDEAEGQVVIIEDEDDEGSVIILNDDDPEEDEVFEVTPEGQAIVELQNRLDVVDLTPTEPAVSRAHITPPITPRERAENAARLHYFLAGIGATLGQRPFRARAARVAVVDLALMVRRQQRRKKAAKDARRRAGAASRLPVTPLTQRLPHRGRVMSQPSPEQLRRPTMGRVALPSSSRSIQADFASSSIRAPQLHDRHRQDLAPPTPTSSFNRPLGQISRGLGLPSPPSSNSRPIPPMPRPDRARSRSSSPTIVPDFWRAPSAREVIVGRGSAESSGPLPAFLRSPGDRPTRRQRY